MLSDRSPTGRTPSTTTWVLLAVCGVAAVVRALYWAVITPTWRPRSDASQYLEIARNISNGDGFSTVFPGLELHATAFRPPLYPVLLALPTWIFGDDVLWPARLLSLLLGVGVVALTFVLVRRISTLRAAVVASLAVACFPPLIANDTLTLTEPLALLLLLVVAITLDARRPLWCGFALGLLVLTRPNAYLVVAIVAFVLWRHVGWRLTLAAVAIAAAVVTPWIVRNAVQVDTFKLTTSDGFTLAAIYGPEARERGLFVDPVFDPSYDGADHKLTALGPEGAWSDELTELAIDGVRDDPGYVAEVVRRNFLSYLELDPSLNDIAERIDGRDPGMRAIGLPIFHLVTVAGLAGLWFTRREPRWWPMMAIVAQFAALSLLLVAPPRLRAPFDLLMCIGVGLLVQHVHERRLRRSGGRDRDRDRDGAGDGDGDAGIDVRLDAGPASTPDAGSRADQPVRDLLIRRLPARASLSRPS